jgi:hypothetical protein
MKRAEHMYKYQMEAVQSDEVRKSLQLNLPNLMKLKPGKLSSYFRSQVLIFLVHLIKRYKNIKKSRYKS